MWAKVKHASNSIRIQVLLLIAGFALALVLSSAAIKSCQQTIDASEELQANAKALASFTARSIEGQFEFLDPQEIETMLGSIKARIDVAAVYAVDADKTMFFDGDAATSSMEVLPGADVMFRAMREANSQNHSDNLYISVAEPLRNESGVIGAMMICFYKPSFMKMGAPIFLTNLLVSLPVLAIGLLLAHAMVQRITAPLEQLARASDKVTSGELDVQLPTQGPREIKHLSSAIGTMLGQLRENIEQIYALAYIDHTTQLPNREYFRRELDRSVHHVFRHDSIGALLFLDLDGFKHVNDTYGHDIGDKLLLEFSQRVSGSLRAGDLMGKDVAYNLKNAYARNHAHAHEGDVSTIQMAARLGGDEFTVLLSDMALATDAAIVSSRILELISQPFLIEGHEISIGASIGIAVFPHDGVESQTILKRADIAMYNAKKSGKNTFRFYNDDIQALSEAVNSPDEAAIEALNKSHYLSKQGLSRLPSLDDLMELPQLTTPALAPDHDIDDQTSDDNLKAS